MDRVQRVRPAQDANPWGADIVDHPAISQYSARNWDDVTIDELALYNPALACPRDVACAQLAREVRRLLAARAWIIDAACVSHAKTASARQRVRADIGRSPLQLTGRHAAIAIGCGIGVASSPPSAALVAWASDEAANMRLIQLLKVLELHTQPAPGLRESTATASLAEVLDLSIDTGINGAYFDGDYDWAHELLFSGAWLGQLARGRTAFMPVGVAQCLLDWLVPAAGRDASRCDGDCRAVLDRRINGITDRPALLACAADVARNGAAARFDPHIRRWPFWDGLRLGHLQRPRGYRT